MVLPTMRIWMIGITLQAVCALLASRAPACAASQSQSMSAELAAMYADDQTTRSTAREAGFDWQTRARQDHQRNQWVKSMLAACDLSSGADFLHAAMLVQHGTTPQDVLLAHELAIIAASKGDIRGPALAAKGLDRYLRRIGALQRYGTQSQQVDNGAMTLEPTDPNVPAALFGVLDVPVPSRVSGTIVIRRKQEKANQELVRLAAEARADSNFSDLTKVDWMAVNRRALARFTRVKASLSTGMVRGSEDFSHAAMLAQIASEADDLLLAHDLAVAAVIRGDVHALPLVAQSMDKYLVRTDRPQRFGTAIVQSWPSPPSLHPVDSSAFDCVRIAFGVPTLEESTRNAAALAAGLTTP
jgi:hypothetical protein